MVADARQLRGKAIAETCNIVWDKEAGKWLDRSLEIKPTWLSLRLKALMLAKAGNTKEAVVYGEKAIAIGEAPPDEVAKIEKQIMDWKKM